MKVSEIVAISIGFIAVFLVCELLAFVAVFGVCMYMPGIDHCGGYEKVGHLWLLAVFLGAVFTWRAANRIKWR